jgi:polyisoprenoid-binding protein YceI
MTTRRKWITALVAVVVVAILAVTLGPYIYIHFIKKKEAASLVSGCAATEATTPANTAGGPSFQATGKAIDPSDAAGTWNVTTGSTVGYRVTENLFGQDTTAVGRSSEVTGTLTVSDGQVSAATFDVDMRHFKSPESRRDRQFNGPIMSVDQFPTAKFVLTQPVPLPDAGAATPAVGDLTLRGVTKPVTMSLSALDCGPYVDVVGSTKITFSDFSIPQPSSPGVSTSSDGTLEVKLKLVKA